MKFTLATGWIAPDGQYYSCYPWDHDRVIIRILKDKGYQQPTILTAEELGYIRVMGRCRIPFLNDDDPTQAQIDTLFEYKQHFNNQG